MSVANGNPPRPPTRIEDEPERITLPDGRVLEAIECPDEDHYIGPKDCSSCLGTGILWRYVPAEAGTREVPRDA